MEQRNGDAQPTEARPTSGAGTSSVGWIAIGVGGLVTAALLVLFLVRASDPSKPLTQLEQVFFGVFTLFAGAGFSWVLTNISTRNATQERFEQLARPALRRVVAARESIELLRVAVDRRRDAAETDSEPFTSLDELLAQHARTLDDAISDWHELLPDEVNQVQSRIAQEALTLRRMEQLEEDLVALGSDVFSQQAKAEQVTELRRDVAGIRRDVELGRLGGPSGFGTITAGIQHPWMNVGSGEVIADVPLPDLAIDTDKLAQQAIDNMRRVDRGQTAHEQ